MREGNRRFAAIGETRTEVRQKPCHRVIERQAPVFYQPHDHRRHIGLGDRGQAEDCILAHRNAVLAIGEAGGAAVDHVAIAGDQHRGADNPPLGERGDR